MERIELLLLEGLVVDSSQVVIVELDMLEFGSEDVHLAAVFEDDLVVEMQEGLLALFDLRVLDKRLPDFGLLEDEDLDNGAVGAEELVEVVVRDDVAELVVDADEEDGTLGDGIVAASHQLYIYTMTLNTPHIPDHSM